MTQDNIFAFDHLRQVEKLKEIVGSLDEYKRLGFVHVDGQERGLLQWLHRHTPPPVRRFQPIACMLPIPSSQLSVLPPPLSVLPPPSSSISINES